jgi:hypothetical protein
MNGHNDCTALPPTADPSGPHTSWNSRRHSNGKEHSPPVAETPPDLSTVEEQTLSASDYFFVNYPFSSEGCGGNTNSCPCGDDCECVGCIIHRFDESTMALPSDPLANGQIVTNGDGTDTTNGPLTRDENFDDGDAGRPVKSCCGR